MLPPKIACFPQLPPGFPPASPELPPVFSRSLKVKKTCFPQKKHVPVLEFDPALVGAIAQKTKTKMALQDGAVIIREGEGKLRDPRHFDRIEGRTYRT